MTETRTRWDKHLYHGKAIDQVWFDDAFNDGCQTMSGTDYIEINLFPQSYYRTRDGARVLVENITRSLELDEVVAHCDDRVVRSAHDGKALYGMEAAYDVVGPWNEPTEPDWGRFPDDEWL